jgi:hypothetical protein
METVKAITEFPLFSLQSKVLLIKHLLRTGKKPPTLGDLQSHQPFVLEAFGAGLVAAIGRGEVPGPIDVRTPEELALLMKLATQPAIVAAFTFLFLDNSQNPATEDIYHHLETTTYFSEAMLWVATALVYQGKWQRGRTLAFEALRRDQPSLRVSALRRDQPSLRELIPLAFWFFQACVHQGLISEAAEILTELDLTERWLPLHEVLKAIRVGSSHHGHLAPELRTVVKSLQETLQAPDKTTATPVRSHPPHKQRLRQKRQR